MIAATNTARPRSTHAPMRSAEVAGSPTAVRSTFAGAADVFGSRMAPAGTACATLASNAGVGRPVSGVERGAGVFTDSRQRRLSRHGTRYLRRHR